MSKRCKDCGAQNEDDRIFCSCCGEPLDTELRFRMTMDKYEKDHKEQTRMGTRGSMYQGKGREMDDEDEIAPILRGEPKKPSKAPWIILGLLIAATAVYFFLFR